MRHCFGKKPNRPLENTVGRAGSSLIRTNPHSPLHTIGLVCLVTGACYLAAQFGGMLMLRPERLWPLWPGCAVLLAMLLLLPKKLWPLFLVAGLAGFVLYDLRVGLPFRSIAILVVGDAVEVLIAAYGISFLFGGVPRLNSARALARYSFFVVGLASVSAATVGALSFGGGYWQSWRMSFATEALALLTLTPAILGLVELARGSTRMSGSRYLEAASLIAGLVGFGYIIFASFRTGSRPELLFAPLPFLLWAALRFGTTGVSSSMILVAALAIWGAVHGRGPFTGRAPLDTVWSLQLFLSFAAATFMVLAAIVDEHKEAAEALREGEERFHLVCDTVPAMIWMSDPDKRWTYFNRQWLDFTGRPIEAELGTGWTAGVYPPNLQSCMETYQRAFDRREPYSTEYRLRRQDGAYRWVYAMGSPSFNHDGSFLGYVGSCIDVTDQKLAQEALSSVSQKLIQAQEEERSRIARELHDDINQRIALIAIELKRLDPTSYSEEDATSHLREIVARLIELGKDVQAISHRLHSAKLEYLGLAAAAGSLCRELSAQHRVKIDYAHDHIPSDLTPEISLCLFRILQEGLNNAVKHSGVRTFRVELHGTSEHVQLTIRDSGIGFDPKLAFANKGIGLTSMQERLHLLKGSLSIESAPTRGTIISALVPFAPAKNPLTQLPHTAA